MKTETMSAEEKEDLQPRAYAKRVEWHVYVEPGPGDRWRACTMMAASEEHAYQLAAHRKFARVTKVTLWATDEVLLEKGRTDAE